MKTINNTLLVSSAVILFISTFICIENSNANTYLFKNNVTIDQIDTFIGADANISREARVDILSLLLSYPAYCKGIETKDGKIYIIMHNGNKILYDDHLKKTFDEKLDNSDMKNMLEQPYATGPVVKEPPKDHDPGRFRVDAFLDSVYGAAAEKVQANSESVVFCNKKYLFSKANGASTALRKVWKEIEIITKANPAVYDQICPSAGTFAWRKIEGTKRKSPHSYSISIDLNTRKTHYWRWTKNSKLAFDTIRNFPLPVIKAFEDNGFIWGGKWSHFDSMHFEYRPELLMKLKIMKQSGSPATGK